jgi:hypothetical protein
MATFTRTVDLTVEAHALGAASPPAWYTTMIADGSIVDTGLVNGVQTYRVATLTGWANGFVGGYVVYVAQVTGPPLVPKYLKYLTKAAFEATYV